MSSCSLEVRPIFESYASRSAAFKRSFEVSDPTTAQGSGIRASLRDSSLSGRDGGNAHRELRPCFHRDGRHVYTYDAAALLSSRFGGGSVCRD